MGNHIVRNSRKQKLVEALHWNWMNVTYVSPPISYDTKLEILSLNFELQVC